MPPTSSKKQPAQPVQPVQVLQVSQSVSPETQHSEPASKKKKAVVSSISYDATSVVTPVPVVRTTPVVVPHTVPVTTVDATPVAVEPVADNVLSTIIDKVNSLAANIKDIQANLKVLSKEYDKQQKIIEKAQKKRQNAKNSPSGFAKPNKISDELCDFIGVPHGTEKSRTDITRFINAYVKEHNLNKPENKRFILPDTKLKKILNVGDSEEINYFILQKLISHHFPASASKIAAKVAVAVAV